MRAVIAILARQHGTNVIAGMAMTQELRSRGDGESTTLDVKCPFATSSCFCVELDPERRGHPSNLVLGCVKL